MACLRAIAPRFDGHESPRRHRCGFSTASCQESRLPASVRRPVSTGKTRKRRDPSLSLSLETSRDDAIDRERKENKRRRNVGKVVKIVTGRAIDTRRDKRLATFARASAPQESSVHDTLRFRDSVEIDHTAPRDASHTRLKLARAKVKGYSEKRNELRKLAAVVVSVVLAPSPACSYRIRLEKRRDWGKRGGEEFCDKF